ncbi:uncharacterized protein DUF4136 [Nonlabens xylanidelens]|uniref:Uncharacterized protein DUF4136 n=1 Tax=Nonlabens xylanidelens TaxID=191564 RepID=A0A2S6ILQ4_9FLAO|nr:DUF4136 domain-containing protein [Nonlabens xylanidelens]PPK95162.1 uncharacterized protein DUF4136 [Nonlabens xylanidelens]PQJ17900.1 hypothetical protein BST94_11635 [Nonlabens xylanidelens]
MKKVLTLLAVITLLVSCQTVRVSQDYAIGTEFNNYKTYAFFKKGIDEAKISELDKKRILRAIDTEMAAKGFVKSENPDIMVSIFTDSKERVDVYNNNWGWGFGYGWGWGGGFWGNNRNSVNRTTEGILYIDLIDAKKKELIWQGVGKAPLKSTPEEKVERTNEIVKEILTQYPPMPNN